MGQETLEDPFNLLGPDEENANMRNQENPPVIGYVSHLQCLVGLREEERMERERERDRWKGDKSTISCPMNELSVVYKCRLVGN